MMGNSVYTENDHLPACVKDVESMRDCLKQIEASNPDDKFHICRPRKNYTAADMYRSFGAFVGRVRECNGHQDSIVLVFFSGHGVTINGVPCVYLASDVLMFSNPQEQVHWCQQTTSFLIRIDLIWTVPAQCWQQ
jgi:hypothetical protein